MEQLNREKSVLVKNLSKQFGVNPETIRNDLTFLEKEGKLKKAYGGAYLPEGVRNDINVRIRETIFLKEKKAIARCCVNYIEDGDTLFLDCSTTSLHIAKNIINKNSLTVVTNSMMVANELSNNVNVKTILLGGVLDNHSLSVLGVKTISNLSDYYVDKTFVSCRGLDIESGITDSNEEQAKVRRMMLERGKTGYLILDNTKFDLISFISIGDISLVDCVITEKDISNDWKEHFKRNNVKLIICEE